MLATSTKRAPAGDQWIHEIKYDEYRMLCHVVDGVPTFMSRRGRNWTPSLSGLVRSLQKVGLEDTILDGELAYFAEDGRTDFEELRKGLRKKSESLSYVAFDLIRHEGRDMIKMPLMERKDILSTVLNRSGPHIRVSEHLQEDGDIVFKNACALVLEGIVSKKKASVYTPGKRSRDWLKRKNNIEEDFLVCGVVERKGEIEALHVGREGEEGFEYCGKVELGPWKGVQEQILKGIAPGGCHLNRKGNGKLNWMKPQIQIRVRFTSWTPGKRIREARILVVLDS